METERSFYEYLQNFSETRSPIDFVLIYDNLPRFFDGALVTLQLTFLALLVELLRAAVLERALGTTGLLEVRVVLGIIQQAPRSPCWTPL